MQLTVTNAHTTLILNDPDVMDTQPAGATLGTARVIARGGNRKNALPFPFTWVPPVNPAGTAIFPVHTQDFLRSQAPMADSMTPGQEWNQLVSQGLVTLAFAASATHRDTTDRAVTLLGT